MLPVKNSSEIVLYQSDNSISIEALLENETIWLTLDNLSLLYGRNKSTISRHIKNIFKEYFRVNTFHKQETNVVVGELGNLKKVNCLVKSFRGLVMNK